MGLGLSMHLCSEAFNCLGLFQVLLEKVVRLSKGYSERARQASHKSSRGLQIQACLGGSEGQIQSRQTGTAPCFNSCRGELKALLMEWVSQHPQASAESLALMEPFWGLILPKSVLDHSLGSSLQTKIQVTAVSAKRASEV